MGCNHFGYSSFLFYRRFARSISHKERDTSESDLFSIWLFARTRIPISRHDGGIDHKTIESNKTYNFSHVKTSKYKFNF